MSCRKVKCPLCHGTGKAFSFGWPRIFVRLAEPHDKQLADCVFCRGAKRVLISWHTAFELLWAAGIATPIPETSIASLRVDLICADTAAVLEKCEQSCGTQDQ